MRRTFVACSAVVLDRWTVARRRREGDDIAGVASVVCCASRTNLREERDLHARRQWAVNEKSLPEGSVRKDSARWRGPRWPGPSLRPGESVYSRVEVAKHDGSTPDGKCWVTYRDGVYDVTHFVHEHPGGRVLLQAAGGPVDGFWRHWAQHHLSPKVADLLEQLRIGRIGDYIPDTDDECDDGGIWHEEQIHESRGENRDSSLNLAERPYQTETKACELASAYITPRSKLYVRNHAPVPSVSPEDADEHVVVFEMEGTEVASLALRELRERFGHVKITSVLQCTGNRAADNIAANGVASSAFGELINLGGLGGVGLMGNVTWGGVKLSQVLRELVAGVVDLSPETVSSLIVTFEGLDGFYTATPLSRILDPKSDCLLAMDMNGCALTPDHGFPVRALLPGIAGARNVKWVRRIAIEASTDSPWTQNYYQDAAGKAIQQLPLNSVLLSPEPGAWLDAQAETVFVKGVAYGGGSGNRITSVEISADRGLTWQAAQCLVEEVPKDDGYGAWGWVRFEAKIALPPLPGMGGPLTEVWCRAHDETGRVQPPVAEANGGYIYNGYHRVPIVRTFGGPPLATAGA